MVVFRDYSHGRQALLNLVNNTASAEKPTANNIVRLSRARPLDFEHVHVPGAHLHLPPEAQEQHVQVPGAHVQVPPLLQLHLAPETPVLTQLHPPLHVHEPPVEQSQQLHLPGGHLQAPPVLQEHAPAAAALVPHEQESPHPHPAPHVQEGLLQPFFPVLALVPQEHDSPQPQPAPHVHDGLLQPFLEEAPALVPHVHVSPQPHVVHVQLGFLHFLPVVAIFVFGVPCEFLPRCVLSVLSVNTRISLHEDMGKRDELTCVSQERNVVFRSGLLLYFSMSLWALLLRRLYG